MDPSAQSGQSLVISPEAHREELFIKLNSLILSEEVRKLGVIVDHKLDFISHIKNITKTGLHGAFELVLKYF